MIYQINFFQSVHFSTFYRCCGPAACQLTLWVVSATIQQTVTTVPTERGHNSQVVHYPSAESGTYSITVHWRAICNSVHGNLWVTLELLKKKNQQKTSSYIEVRLLYFNLFPVKVKMVLQWNLIISRRNNIGWANLAVFSQSYFFGTHLSTVCAVQILRWRTAFTSKTTLKQRHIIIKIMLILPQAAVTAAVRVYVCVQFCRKLCFIYERHLSFFSFLFFYDSYKEGSALNCVHQLLRRWFAEILYS